MHVSPVARAARIVITDRHRFFFFCLRVAHERVARVAGMQMDRHRGSRERGCPENGTFQWRATFSPAHFGSACVRLVMFPEDLLSLLFGFFEEESRGKVLAWCCARFYSRA